MTRKENHRPLTLKAKSALALAGLIMGAVVMGFSAPVDATAQTSLSEVVQRRATNAQVIDTHWQYECPRGIAGHDIGKYDVKYKTITFTNSFYVSKITPIAIKYVDNCSCSELGQATQYKYTYTLT